MKKIVTLLLLIMITATAAFARRNIYAVIPKPRTVTPTDGVFVITPQTGISAQKTDGSAAELFREFLSVNFGMEIKPEAAKSSVKLTYDAGAGDEEYNLSVKPSGITVSGGHAGVFYGLQTLQQLVREDNGRVYVPCVEIADKPRFEYRGLLFDVGRYYFPVDYIKRFIDLMARYKFNKLHWHLTEDQGWRIEIKSYPELTRFGAWRSSSQLTRDKLNQDRLPHGGFYTREQVRDIVKYAGERHVTVIPEIDLPGHTMSALACYPELSCTGGPFLVPVEWGVKKDVLCAGNEDTYRFVESVLAEVIELFPGEYINIGGDEVPKDRWKACPKCQAKIKAEKLRDENELQGYFTRRVNEFVNGRGRKIIAWDDILDGGVVEKATVLSWRDETGGIKAAGHGVNVIMCPASYMYLDYYQSADQSAEPFNISGNVPLEVVYRYEPYTKKLSAEQHKYIIGIQGNLWTEYIHNSAKMDYMAYPRALAVAETGWSAAEDRDYDDFITRLPPHLAYLDRAGVMFRIPEPKGLEDAVVRDGKAYVELVSPVEGAGIYYTTNGLNPTVKGKLYTEPFEVRLAVGTQIKCVVRLPSGRTSAVYTVKNRK